MDVMRSALVRSVRYDHGYEWYNYTGRRKYDELNDIFHGAAHYALSPADSKKLEACRLENLTESARRYFKAMLKQAVRSPQNTYMYKWNENTETENEWSVDSAEMLRQIELEGLQALGFLGEIDSLPHLMTAVWEDLEATDPQLVGGRMLSDVNMLLRFLMGQHLRIRYIVPREERLERTLPAMERIPLVTRLKLGDLGDWEVMLGNARKKIEAFATHTESNEKRRIKLDEEVWSLWDELEKWSLYLEFEALWYFPLLERNRSLEEWIVDLDHILQLLEQPGYALPTDLEKVEIWSGLLPEGGWHEFEIDGDTYRVPYYNRYEAVWPYWGYLYSYFRCAWQLASGARLEATEWQVDARTVRMITKWRLPIRAIEKLNVEGSEDTYWMIAFEPGQPAHVPVTSNALLLNLQLLLERGGNKFRPLAQDNDQLTIELQTPRADNSSSPPSPDPLPKGVIEQVAHYILASVLPGYSEVSQRSEAALLQEIDRIKPYIPPFDWPIFDTEEQKLFYGLQEAFDEVVWIRKTFAEHLEVLSQMLSEA